MIIAAIYPVFLFIFVYRQRRTWLGLAIALCGTALLWPIARLVRYLVQQNAGEQTGVMFSNLVYGEMTLIGLIALWLVSMKRRTKQPLCPYCHYDMTGLPVGATGTTCPECGNTLKAEPMRPWMPVCHGCGMTLEKLDPTVSGQTCPGCGADESQFGNWTRAKALRTEAIAKRAAGNQGRSSR